MSKDHGSYYRVDPPLGEDSVQLFAEDSLRTLSFFPSSPFLFLCIRSLYLKTPPTWDSWWPHLAGTQLRHTILILHVCLSSLTLSPVSTSLLLLQLYSLETQHLLKNHSPLALSLGSLQMNSLPYCSLISGAPPPTTPPIFGDLIS